MTQVEPILKKIFFLLILTIVLFACDKDNLVPTDEIPEWLKERIEEEESGITAWIRYEYMDEYYFEYMNPILSSWPPTYDYDGNYIEGSIYQNYQENKCCKKYVWKASRYEEP